MHSRDGGLQRAAILCAALRCAAPAQGGRALTARWLLLGVPPRTRHSPSRTSKLCTWGLAFMMLLVLLLGAVDEGSSGEPVLSEAVEPR